MFLFLSRLLSTRIVQTAFWGLSALLFFGCAKGMRTGPISPDSARLVLPDSLRAELDLTAQDGRRQRTVSAVLASIPGERYKLDLFGLPGMLGGSFLWMQEEWNLVLFEEGVFFAGQGDRVSLPNLKLDSLPVHALSSFLWGGMMVQEIDASPAPAETTDTPASRPSEKWVLQRDSRTGLPSRAVEEISGIRLDLSQYTGVNGRPVPRQVRISDREGKHLLDIRVKRVDDNPTWKRDPFFLRIPPGFREIDSFSTR